MLLILWLKRVLKGTTMATLAIPVAMPGMAQTVLPSPQPSITPNLRPELLQCPIFRPDRLQALACPDPAVEAIDVEIVTIDN